MEVPDDDPAIDAWIADIEARLREVRLPGLVEYGRPSERELMYSGLWPYVASVRGAIVALQHARRRWPPSVRFQLIIELAQADVALAEARRAEDRLWARRLWEELEDALRAMDRDTDCILAEIEAADGPRQAALAKARERQQQRSQDLQAKIETLRSEFEARLRCGMSASRAAQLLGERHGLNWETIRKRLRGPPRK
jgi:hypothetical protein